MTDSAELTKSSSAPTPRDIDDRRLTEALEAAFAQCFNQDFNTRLVGGAPEPLYLPESQCQPAKLMYREDFPASALHEVAHWCVAGEARRQREDFGYHYISGRRTPDQQAAFFALELHAQCLEKRFSQAAGLDFLPSADNLLADLVEFRRRIDAFEPQLLNWLASPAGTRAKCFIQYLEGVFLRTLKDYSLEYGRKRTPNLIDRLSGRRYQN